MVKIEKEKILLTPKSIKPSSNKFEVLGVLNPGAARLKDGRIILYVRVIEKLKKTEDSKYFYSPRFVGKKNFQIEIDKFSKDSVVSNTDMDFNFKDGTKRLTYISHLRRVFLDKSGFKILKIDSRPSFFGLSWDAELGVEDPRIAKIGEIYYMTYVGLGRSENISTNFAFSKDCLNWSRKGVIFGEQDKDVVLFPEKIKDRFVAFDRPEGNFEFTPPHMWIAYSKDLEYWGKLKAVSLSKKIDFSRSGAGPPPIKTEKGWLLIFHAVTRKKYKNALYFIKRSLGFNVNKGLEYSQDDVYSVWAGLFDFKNPNKLIAKSSKPIMSPNKKENKSFEGKEVLFPTGIIVDKNSILLYSGFGDSLVGVSKIKLKDVLDSLNVV
jgi:beta-1,2-mannobiose phosphorylase / 1,2-beta-oligomannan phosphorylase